jgi:hypothetical protein
MIFNQKGPILSGLPWFASVAILLGSLSDSFPFAATNLVVFHALQRIKSPEIFLEFGCCNLITISAVAITITSGFALQSHSGPRSRRFLLALVTLLIVLSLPYVSSLLSINQCSPKSDTKFRFDDDHYLWAHAESNTGFVSVVQIKTEYGPVKVMRCDHTILGGTFMDHDNQSIFKTFLFMDFVRFVKRPSIDMHGFDIKNQIALQIGLGIGASAKTLMDSGAVVDVVELDPILYRYAIEYFDLPTPRSAFLIDGRVFLDKAAEKQYDFVLHDVFSGGVVPSSLFSIEALQKIDYILKDDGVLAVNFVGTRSGTATLTVFKTLKGVFKNVIAYEEDPGVGDEEVMNFVFYATNFGDSILFDFEQDSTFPGNSMVYQGALKEVRNSNPWAPDLLPDGAVITDANNPLMSLQEKSARGHFYLLQKVFPHRRFWSDMF